MLIGRQGFRHSYLLSTYYRFAHAASSSGVSQSLRNADSLNDLRLEIKLHGKDAKNRNIMAGIGNMDLVPDSSNPMATNRF